MSHHLVLVNNSDDHQYLGYTAKHLLLEFPIGGFSTARTFNRNKILCLDLHIERLIQSTSSVVSPSVLPSEHILRTSIRETIRTALHNASKHIPSEAELRITIIVAQVDHQLRFISHTTELPPLPRSNVTTRLEYYNRKDAQMKTTSWVAERKTLERYINNQVHEVLLGEEKNGKCFLHEGLSSNVFTLSNSKLFTCPIGMVLGGTIRAMVIKAASLLGIPIVEQCPVLEEAEALFITSTSRLILPVGTLQTKDMGELKFESEGCFLVTRLSRKVLELLELESEIP
ncbi:hypothetical protein P9112_007807 [Eukaryota sp. TZLM1-RC]